MNETILITGATGKIGSQLAQHFYEKGFCVIFTSRSQENIEKFINKRKNIFGIEVDLNNNNAIEVIKDYLEKNNLKVNYLVNNARNIESLKVEEDGSILDENWQKEYQIDVVSPYKLARELANTGFLKKIINISSMYGMCAYNPHLYYKAGSKIENFAPALQYACAKAALIHLTKCLAVIYAQDNISVNCVTYGGVEGRVDDEFKKRYAILCPKGRMMFDNETIGAVDFLISENSAYITGQNIVVDGGWSIW